MVCKNPPTVEVLWANGHGHAWFCAQCFTRWKDESDWHEIDYEKEIEHGIARRRFQDRKSPEALEEVEEALAEHPLPAPFISTGTKGYLAKYIAANIPNHTTFVAPWCGSATTLFAKAPSPKEILNDIDPEIVVALSAIKHSSEAEILDLERRSWGASKVRYKWIEQWKPTRRLDKLYRSLYLRWFGWGGTISFTNRSVSVVNRIKRVVDASKRLKDVIIVRGDALKCIEQWDSPSTFFYCALPGSLISMVDGSKKLIEKISVGDQVIGGKVLRVFRREVSEKVFEIKVMGLPRPISVTAEHPVQTLRFSRKPLSNNAVDKIIDSGWLQASLISKGDFVAIPRYGVRENSEKWIEIPKVRSKKRGRLKVLPERVPLDARFTRLLGLYLAEGSVWKASGRPYGIGFSFGGHEENTLVAETRKLIRDIFGLGVTISHPKKSVFQVIASSRILGEWFMGMFGQGACQKQIPLNIVQLPPDLLLPLLRGWLDGDGGVWKEESGGGTRFKITGTTCSYTLARQMYQIAIRCGLSPCFKRRQNAFDVYFTSVDCEALTGEAPGWKIRQKRKQTDGILWAPVTNIKRVAYTGPVYNLEVNGTNTYVLDFVLSHNCDPPYPEAERKHYFSVRSFYHSLRDIARVLTSIQGAFILSISDTPEAHAAFSQFYIRRLLFKDAPSGRGGSRRHRAELFISNFELPNKDFPLGRRAEFTDEDQIGEVIGWYVCEEKWTKWEEGIAIAEVYPNEHACRIREPSEFQKGSFRRITSGKVHIIIGRLKGKTSTTTQAIRYRKSVWGEDAARTHCSGKGGRFEAARVGEVVNTNIDE